MRNVHRNEVANLSSSTIWVNETQFWYAISTLYDDAEHFSATMLHYRQLQKDDDISCVIQASLKRISLIFQEYHVTRVGIIVTFGISRHRYVVSSLRKVTFPAYQCLWIANVIIYRWAIRYFWRIRLPNSFKSNLMHRTAEWIKYWNGNLQLSPVFLCLLLRLPLPPLVFFFSSPHFSFPAEHDSANSKSNR